MEINIFDFISDMENDLAELYRHLQTMGRFHRSREIFESMTDESRKHSKDVASFHGKHKKTDIDKIFFLKLQRKIKNTLLSELSTTRDMNEAIKKIAHTEEQLGKMYQLLAAHYRKLSEYYMDISRDIEEIAEDEFSHRDIIMKEMHNYG